MAGGGDNNTLHHCLGQNLNIKINISFTGFDKNSYLKYMGVDKFDIVKANLKKISQINNDNSSLSLEITMRHYEGCDEAKKTFIEFLDSINLNYKIHYGFDTWGGLLEDNISKFKRRKSFD